jgi:glycosyltransferase involved in cell wall biosynthesis
MEVLRHWSGRDLVQIDFLITSGQKGIFDDEARALGANLHYVRYGRRELVSFLSRFRRILREGSYDAIHDHQAFVSGWHYLAGVGHLPHVRVTHVHNAAIQITENYGVTALRRLTAQVGRALVAMFATHVAGTSRQLVTEYGFDERLFTGIRRLALHCGFDAGRFQGDVEAARASLCEEFAWPADSRIILFAGRMDPSPDIGQVRNQKNSGLAVAVGIECARRDPRIRMLFAGRTTQALPVLEQRIATAGFAGRFRFPGTRTDIERLMLGSHVLLFPSRAEGLGMVAVEAQAAGLPVVASTGVPRECVVVPDLVRFLDPAAGDHVWADQVLAFADQPRRNAEANARVASSPFAIARSSQALLDIYSGYRTA